MSNYKNLASTVLENSGQTTDTSITVPSTTAALFPTPPFYATIMPTNSGLANGSNSEIVEVTAATTSGANTIFSISRAQRGTSAISWDANKAILSHAIYTQDMPFIDKVLSTPPSVAYVATDNIQTGAVTTPKIADGAVTSDKIDWATVITTITAGGITSIKFESGLLVQIGSISITTGSSATSDGRYWVFQTVSFPIPFKDTNYYAEAESAIGTGSISNNPRATASVVTNSQASIGLQANTANFARDVKVFAIGLWK